MQNKKVLMFGPSYFGYAECIVSQLEAMGAQVDFYNDRPNNSGLCKALVRYQVKAYYPTVVAHYTNAAEENKDKDSASNAMCTFLAMNTAGFQLIPATVIAILVAVGSKNPTEIILPTIIVTSIAFVSAILIAKLFQRIWAPQKSEVEND